MDGRECLDCGFISPPGENICGKCDARLSAQTDGSEATIDIAHQSETVVVATDKLTNAIARHMRKRTQHLRVITGQGTIRDAIQPLLASMAHAGKIIRFEQDGRNPGALLVTLRR